MVAQILGKRDRISLGLENVADLGICQQNVVAGYLLEEPDLDVGAQAHARRMSKSPRQPTGFRAAVGISASSGLAPELSPPRDQAAHGDETCANALYRKKSSQRECTFDDSKSPKAMNFGIKKGRDGGKTQPCISKIEGDKVTILAMEPAFCEGMYVLRVLAVPMALHGLYDTLLKKDMNLWALLVALASFGWLALQIERARGVMPEAGLEGRKRRVALGA